MINRFERKFVFKQTSAKNIEILIKLNKVGFYEIFYERYINNIYFDTINFDNYYDNIDGVSDRVKHRIRWYNNFFLNSKDAVFEIKRRKGLLVNKETLLLDNFHLNENINISKYLNQKCEVQKKELIHNHNLFPVLINRYKRRYFLSRDKKFRATIDSNIEAYKANIYLKQLQFYYKYCESLFTLENDLLFAVRAPRQYLFDIDSDDLEYRFEIETGISLDDIQSNTYDKLKVSIDSYKESSASAKNWGAYAATVISDLEKDMEWIPFVW